MSGARIDESLVLPAVRAYFVPEKKQWRTASKLLLDLTLVLMIALSCIAMSVLFGMIVVE